MIKKAYYNFKGTVMRIGIFCLSMLLLSLTTACTPTVKVQAPDKPIDINLNVKIQHEVYIRVDKELDNILNDSSGLF